MKKTLIAGAASAVLAAMPVIGVFATDHINGSPVVDTLQVNLQEVCTLSRGTNEQTPGPAHPTGTTATWTTGTVTSDDPQTETVSIAGVNVPLGASRDVAAADIIAGNYYNNFAQSSFKVVCNNVNGGYKVTVAASEFTGVDGAATWAYAAGGADYTAAQITDASASAWTLDSSTASKTLASGIVWSKGANANNTFESDSFTITYKVKAATAQEQGTYTADAVYTLTDID